jgi:hypothetical protein
LIINNVLSLSAVTASKTATELIAGTLMDVLPKVKSIALFCPTGTVPGAARPDHLQNTYGFAWTAVSAGKNVRPMTVCG